MPRKKFQPWQPAPRFVLIDLVLFRETELIEESRAPIFDDEGLCVASVGTATKEDAATFACHEVPESTVEEFYAVPPGTFDSLVEWALPSDDWIKICEHSGHNPNKHRVNVVTELHPDLELQSLPLPPVLVIETIAREEEDMRMTQLSLEVGTCAMAGTVKKRGGRPPLPRFYLVNSALHESLVQTHSKDLTAGAKRRMKQGALIPDATLNTHGAPVEVAANTPCQALWKARETRIIGKNASSWVAVSPERWEQMQEELLVNWIELVLHAAPAFDPPVQLQLFG